MSNLKPSDLDCIDEDFLGQILTRGKTLDDIQQNRILLRQMRLKSANVLANGSGSDVLHGLARIKHGATILSLPGLRAPLPCRTNQHVMFSTGVGPERLLRCDFAMKATQYVKFTNRLGLLKALTSDVHGDTFLNGMQT